MLSVYRASAGSGKTHLLTGFYIKLLFHRSLTPCVEAEGRDLFFGEILAVTFTNKATAEMKERIIQEIYKLWKEPEKSQFISLLTAPAPGERNRYTLSQVKQRAEGILRSMLYDYSELHISTIDSFFQRVLHSFAHELNLPGGLEIELDEKTMLDHAVSDFIVHVDKASDAVTFSQLLEYSKKRISEGESWNIHSDLFALAEVLTSETYKKERPRIAAFANDVKQLTDYKSRMWDIEQKYIRDLKEIGRRGLKILEDNNFTTTEFSGAGSSTMRCLEHWNKGETTNATSTLLKWTEDPQKWFKKDNPRRSELSATETEKLRQVLAEGYEMISGIRFVAFNSARVIRTNLYQLGLITKLEEAAENYCKSNEMELLSNAAEKLSSLIGEEDSPFVYEKTGVRLQSYMIDEFQDTSRIQWRNFDPLVRNSVGNGSENLIVGDVKQSIYRWRGSDWDLLYKQINHYLSESHRIDQNGNRLVDNWRSDLKIIQFNNRFFKFAAEVLGQLAGSPEIEDIYKDVRQSVSRQRIQGWREKGFQPGLVCVEQVAATGDQKPEEACMQRLPEVVLALQAKGYKPGQILILARRGKQCIQAAEALLSYRNAHPEVADRLNVITDEALKLNNSLIVQGVIAMLQWMQEPHSEARKAIAACCYHKGCGLDAHEAVSRYFDGQDCPDILIYRHLPLYETLERIISLFPAHLCQREMPYLQALRDYLLEFVGKEGSNLAAFLRLWSQKADSLCISTPTEQEAIQILTIHKSKGLGKEVVILPFTSWDMDIDTSHSNILWCEPKDSGPGIPDGISGFALDTVLPVPLKPILKDTIFKADFEHERLYSIIDNLNTTYVAFTRAKNALVLLTPELDEKKKASSHKIEYLLDRFLQSWNKKTDPLPLPNTAATDEPASEPQPTHPTGMKQPAELELPLDYGPNFPTIKTTGFQPETGPIARGNTLHEALSAVRDLNSIDEPVRHRFSSGQAELQGITLPEVLQTVHQLLDGNDQQSADDREHIRQWFDPANIVFNEHNIITSTKHTQRPDRLVFRPDGKAIIIDYKTGAEHPTEHQRQVAHYINLVRQMGYKDVEGWLWYFESGNIVPVN